jgi:O-antigen ligase
LAGTAVGLLTALVLHFGLGQSRAAEGFFLTDPYRLAVTTLLLATLALGALFTRARWRWLAPLGLVAALIVIALTGSRTALIGLPVLLFVSALCFVRRPLAIVAVFIATTAIGIGALFVELPGTARTSLWSTLANIANGGQASDVAIALRLVLYRAGIDQFWTSPIFGHGWSEAMMAPILAQLTPEQMSWGKLVHLHNDVLQFAVAGGLLGLGAWLLILLAPLIGYLQLPADAKGPAKLHATLVLVVGYFVLGLPDLMLASPLQLTLYVTLSAAVLGMPKRVT